jgi:hypothetical protein
MDIFVVRLFININDVKLILGLIEDGGEMIMVSVILWYVYKQYLLQEK